MKASANNQEKYVQIGAAKMAFAPVASVTAIQDTMVSIVVGVPAQAINTTMKAQALVWQAAQQDTTKTNTQKHVYHAIKLVINAETSQQYARGAYQLLN